jgi:hypothetical protein
MKNGASQQGVLRGTSQRPWGGALATGLLLWTGACASAGAGDPHSTGGADAGTDGAGGVDAEPPLDSGPGTGCGCTPGSHNELIYVLSDNGELWTYDPESSSFGSVTGLNCGTNSPYSMAVDPFGMAWILLTGTSDIHTIDVNQPNGCGDSGYKPGQQGFGLFGMAFATNSATEPCAKLYVHTYSGAGPFGEGPNAGALGVMDPESLTLSKIADIDYNGGELAGTGDGRLFAFAGQNPAKLIEYDKSTGMVLDLIALDGFHKTNASAFAFYRGDAYFFTEAPPSGCASCLDQTCPQLRSSCLAQPACAEDLACAIAAGDISDVCGGSLPQALQDCVFVQCGPECFPPPSDKISQVTQLDYDGSGGQGRTMTVVNPAAPIRIVGAGASTCVQTIPR